MTVSIGSETELEAYFKTFTAIDGIEAVVYVDTDADMDSLVENYFKNRYKGPAMFVGVMEESIRMDESLTYTKPNIGLTVIGKYDKQRPDMLSKVREDTKVMLIRSLHKIKTDFEDTYDKHPKEPGEHWTFEMAEPVILPVGDMANSGCRGWFAEIKIGWPVTYIR